MYKLFLCLRYLHKRRIAFFAVAAVCLCVAMVLIVVSVMDGFLQMVKDRSRGMLGDLVMENGTLQGFAFYQEFIDTIKAEMPDIVEEATPVIISYGVIRFPNSGRTNMAQLVGIRLEETCRVNEFSKGLFYEQYYPGSTTLGKFEMPCYGRDAQGNSILPPDLEAGWQQWWKKATPKERRNAEINEDASYKRPGYYRPIPLEESAKRGSFEPTWVGPARDGVILGTDLCATRNESGKYVRHYYRGEEVSVTFVPFSDTGQLSDLSAHSRLYRYADDVRTGVYDIDSISVYLDFNELQKNLRMDSAPLADYLGGHELPPRTTQVQFRLNDALKKRYGKSWVEAIRGELMTRWSQFADEQARQWAALTESRIRAYEQGHAATAPTTEEADFWGTALSAQERITQILSRVTVPLSWVDIQTWEEKQARFILAVEKEKILVTILFGVISVVAVFLVGCIFYMIVQQKTRDIGIVKSVGATAFGVAQIFLTYGAAVGVVGGAMGTILGTVFVWKINEIQDMLRWINPTLQVWSPDVYSFDRIPNEVTWLNVLVIYAVAIVASMFGSLMAAWRAARVWPVEALRYE